MVTKLTLTIEESVIEKAKTYAKAKGDSLSGIISSETLVSDVEFTPLVKSLKGSFSAPEDYDYKKELKKGLSEKYL